MPVVDIPEIFTPFIISHDRSLPRNWSCVKNDLAERLVVAMFLIQAALHRSQSRRRSTPSVAQG